MLRRLIISLLVTVATALAAVGAPPAWEHVTNPPAEFTEVIDTDTQTEIAVRDGYIYIYLSRPTQVRLFSILGQPIATENLAAGTHRLRLTQRGIYLLRAGSTTRRVTI